MIKQEEVIQGELEFENKVVQKITAIALEKVDGLLTIDGGFFSTIVDKVSNNQQLTAGINVEIGKTQVAVDIKIAVEYGRDIPKMYKEIKEVIGEEVKKMTDLEVIEVNVTVSDIRSQEEFKKVVKTPKERVSQVSEELDRRVDYGEIISKEKKQVK